jgi:hypothetical protein
MDRLELVEMIRRPDIDAAALRGRLLDRVDARLMIAAPAQTPRRGRR